VRARGAAHEVEEGREHQHVRHALGDADRKRRMQADRRGERPEQDAVGERGHHEERHGRPATARAHEERDRRGRAQQVHGHERLRLAQRRAVAVDEQLLEHRRRHGVGHRRQHQQQAEEERDGRAAHGFPQA